MQSSSAGVAAVQARSKRRRQAQKSARKPWHIAGREASELKRRAQRGQRAAPATDSPRRLVGRQKSMADRRVATRSVAELCSSMRRQRLTLWRPSRSWQSPKSTYCYVHRSTGVSQMGILVRFFPKRFAREVDDATRYLGNTTWPGRLLRG